MGLGVARPHSGSEQMLQPPSRMELEGTECGGGGGFARCAQLLLYQLS